MVYFKKYGVPAIFVGFLVFLDQWTKWLAVRHLAPLYEFAPPRDVELIGGLLRLTYLENHGMAFGLMQGHTWIFIVLTIIIVPGLAYWYFKTKPVDLASKLYRVALLMLIGGALGNFFDRVLNYGGGVVDFIRIEFFPFVFNVADIFVVVPVVSLLVLTFFMKDEAKDAKKD